MASPLRATLVSLASSFALGIMAAVRDASVDEIVALDRGPGDARSGRRSPARPLGPRVTEATRAWAAMYGLTEIETEIVRRAALGQTRKQIARARGCSELTVKKHVSNLLPRTGDRSLQDALLRLLREVATR